MCAWVCRDEIPTQSHYLTTSQKSFRIYNFDGKLVTLLHNLTYTWKLGLLHTCTRCEWLSFLFVEILEPLCNRTEGGYLARHQMGEIISEDSNISPLVSECESKEPFLAAASPCPERNEGEMNALQ